jgi:arabinofuranan 3-O-arabinosyltransferase
MDDENSIALLGGSLKTSIHWPDRILGPRPGLKEVNLACWGMFVAFLIVPVSIVFWLHSQTGSGSIRKLHADFVYFYGVGQIAHQYSAVRVYDFELQQKTFNQIYPLHDRTYGPSPYPPFVALFFSLFARMSFETAYLLWAVVSLALYTVGIAATANEVFPGDRLKTSLIFCFALAFYPFSFDTLMNGQLAAVAVCAVGLAISQERHSRPFCSGLALSMLAYKPTLLLLILPMLLLTRRFKSLFGFMTGTVVLMLVATAWAGVHIWPTYWRFLRGFGHVAGLGGQSALRLWQFVDFRSLSYAVPGGRSAAALAALICLGATIGTWLVVLLYKSAAGERPEQYLTWAVTLTWTLLLNIYVPTYDSVLVTIAVILTLGALRDMAWSTASGWIVFLSVLIFLSSWVTEGIAQRRGIQLLSILIAVLGFSQLYLLHQLVRKNHRNTVRAAVAVGSSGPNGSSSALDTAIPERLRPEIAR